MKKGATRLSETQKKKAPPALRRNGAFRRGKKPGTSSYDDTTMLVATSVLYVLYDSNTAKFHLKIVKNRQQAISALLSLFLALSIKNYCNTFLPACQPPFFRSYLIFLTF